MSFFTNLRADRLVTEIRSATDPGSPATQKAVARLKEIGAGAIESIFAALPDADKTATVAFVDVLSSLVSQKTFPQFVRGLVEGSPRVVSGISWALTSSRNYPPHLLLEALATAGRLQAHGAGGDRGAEVALHGARAADCRLRTGAE